MRRRRRRARSSRRPRRAQARGYARSCSTPDALTSFAGDAAGLAALIAGERRATVVTPHEGQVARLFSGRADSYLLAPFVLLSRIREIEALGYHPYGRRFDYTHTIPEIVSGYGGKTAEELLPPVRVRVAGRLMTLRHMGKAGFAHLQQNGERLQIYVKKDAVGERDFRSSSCSISATSSAWRAISSARAPAS